MHLFPMADRHRSIPAAVPGIASESIMNKQLLRHSLGVVFACLAGAALAAGHFLPALDRKGTLAA
jgi:hypothetical protein